MKRPVFGGGFTAAAVLIVAVLGGAVGGAVAMSGSQAPAPAAPVTLHQVAVEATPNPEPSAAAEAPAPVPQPSSIPTGDAVEPVTPTAPAPVAPVGGGGETAAEAADRAAAEADRAEKAADRAESAPKAEPVAPKPTPAPVVEEEPVPADPTIPKVGAACDVGLTSNYGGDSWSCPKGKWVRTAPVPVTPQQSCTSPKGEPGDVVIFGGAEPNRVAEHRCVKGNWVRTGQWTTPSPVDTADPVTPKD